MRQYLAAALVCFLYFSAFSQTWEPQVSGTTNTLRHIHFVDDNIGWAVGHNGTVLKTTNGGTNWVKQTIGNGNQYLIGCYFVNENTGWVLGDDGIYKTTNGGTDWTTQAGPTGTKCYFLNETTGWAVGGIDGSTPYCGDIYITTDGGVNWSSKTNNTEWARFYGVQFVNENVGWVYTEVNGLLLKTTDGGENWQTQLSYKDSVKIRGIFFLDENNGWVVGHSSNSSVLLKTTDGGATWTDKGVGMQYGCGYPKFFGTNVGTVLANGGPNGRGVLKTTDGGDNWIFYPAAGNPRLTGIFFLDENNGWAFGDGGEIYKFTDTSVDVKYDANKPAKFYLKQNYPNPFNPSTTIYYEIPKGSLVTLKVYDMLGKEVQTLVDKEQAIGEYIVEFDGSGLPSGTYLCKLTVAGFTQTMKMSLVK